MSNVIPTEISVCMNAPPVDSMCFLPLLLKILQKSDISNIHFIDQYVIIYR